MTRRTPQEKKRLSYERDCRYNYGNSPQAARRCVPLRKALRNRANRHYQNQQLVHLGQKPDQTLVDEVETLIQRRPPKDWRKDPDAPLGEVLQRKHERRALLQTEEGRRARAGSFIIPSGKMVNAPGTR